MNKTALIAEVKINKSKIDLNILKEKSKALAEMLNDYNIEFVGYSIEDM